MDAVLRERVNESMAVQTINGKGRPDTPSQLAAKSGEAGKVNCDRRQKGSRGGMGKELKSTRPGCHGSLHW